MAICRTTFQATMVFVRIKISPTSLKLTRIWLVLFLVAKSAFTVHLPVASSAGMIKFSEVVNHKGSHYSTSTGRFTCQYPGIYVFHLHIMKEDLQSEAYCNIRKNSIDLITASSFTYGDATRSLVSASTSAVLQLAQGDIVDIASCSHISTIRHGWETSFSGYLLQEI